MLLSLTDVSRSYRDEQRVVTALQSVSLELDAGEFVAIHGPSGCGKSTLLLTAGTLLKPDSGTVEIDGTDPYAMSSDARATFRSNQIGFVFQQFHLVPYLSVLDNVLAPSIAQGGSAELRDRALQLVQQFGLGDRAHHVPSHLSSGERQRCALARAMLKQPRLILADEPTGNLDEQNAQLVLKSLRDLTATGTAVLLVTHDPRAGHVADRRIEMAAGAIYDRQAAPLASAVETAE